MYRKGESVFKSMDTHDIQSRGLWEILLWKPWVSGHPWCQDFEFFDDVRWRSSIKTQYFATCLRAFEKEPCHLSDNTVHLARHQSDKLATPITWPNVLQLIWYCSFVRLAHKEQMQFIVLKSRTEWEIIVRQYATSCVPYRCLCTLRLPLPNLSRKRQSEKSFCFTQSRLVS